MGEITSGALRKSAIEAPADIQRIAILGAGNAADKGQAFDWIGELKSRPANARRDVLTFGAGGDLAWNALQRVPDMVAVRPDKIVVWSGGNDILASVSDKARRFLTAAPPGEVAAPAEWFLENLRTIVHRLKAQTGARIALCSLPPIGEAPGSGEPFQRELNAQVEHYSAIIAHLAYSEGCAYIPLYEAFSQQIEANPGRAFTELRLLPFYIDAFRSRVLGQDTEALALRNGWLLHSDGIHLNRRGGLIAADLVQQFLDA